MKRSGEPRYDHRATGRIFRRAAELVAASAGAEDGMTESELVAAAAEAGLEPWAVRRAAREERLGLLEAVSNRSLVCRAATPRRRDLVDAELTYELGRRGLVLAPADGVRQEWLPRGWWPDERSMGGSGSLLVRTVDHPQGTEVVIATDLGGTRRRHFLGAGLGAAFGAGLVVGSLPIFLVPLALVLVMAGGTALAMSSYRSRVGAIERRLTSLLADVTQPRPSAMSLPSRPEVEHGTHEFELRRR